MQSGKAENEKHRKEIGKLQEFDFELSQGERVLLRGANGSGKSGFIKAVLKAADMGTDVDKGEKGAYCSEPAAAGASVYMG